MASEYTVDLTESELAKVGAKKKETPSKIYRKDSASYVSISRDMEAFLILDGIDFKSTMTDVVKAASDDSSDSLESDLFDEAVKNEDAETDEILAECNSGLGMTETVRKKVNESKFVNVDDIASLFSDVSESGNKLAVLRKLAKFNKVYLQKLQDRFSPANGSDSEQVKQVKSWLTPLTDYT